MSINSEEPRIAALLSELIQQGDVPAEAIEARLGWEPGRLSALLAQGVSFEVLLDVLPALDATPSDFFARLYGAKGRDEEAGGGLTPRGGDRRFEESRRVVKAALARRSAGKEEKPGERGPT